MIYGCTNIVIVFRVVCAFRCVPRSLLRYMLCYVRCVSAYTTYDIMGGWGLDVLRRCGCGRGCHGMFQLHAVESRPFMCQMCVYTCGGDVEKLLNCGTELVDGGFTTYIVFNISMRTLYSIYAF